MIRRNNKKLYESIIRDISRTIKRYINKSNMINEKLNYNLEYLPESYWRSNTAENILFKHKGEYIEFDWEDDNAYAFIYSTKLIISPLL